MASTTTRGYPFPQIADKMRDIVTTVKALADFLEANVKLTQSGKDTVDIVTTNVSATKAVLFPTAYPVGVVPDVTLTVRTLSSATAQRFVAVSAESNTGFTVTGLNNTNNTDIGFTWHARG